MPASKKKNQEQTTSVVVTNFVNACMKTGSVWGLHGPKGWLTLTTATDSGDEIQVIPLWSSEKDVQVEINDETPHIPTAISLWSFVDVWIADLAHDQVLLGLNIGVKDSVSVVDVTTLEKEFLKHLPAK